MPQLKKIDSVIFEKRHCDVAHLMTVKASQIGTNHHQDLMKNRVIPGISVDAVLFVILHAVNEINFDHRIIETSPNNYGVK
jgi:hypothetical protein